MTSTLSPVASIEESISLLARRASLPRVHQQLNSRAGVDLGWYAYIALYWIDAAGPLRLTELADLFGVVPSTVCRHVQQLESAGLVNKVRDPSDGRAVRLSPTDRGRKILDELRASRQTTYSDKLAGWSSSDLSTLSGLLLRLRQDLDETADD